MGDYMLIVKAILINRHKHTVGARVLDTTTGKVTDYTTEQLRVNRDMLQLENVVLDKSGYVRSKMNKGNLPRETVNWRR